jgi:hypothetical protein
MAVNVYINLIEANFMNYVKFTSKIFLVISILISASTIGYFAIIILSAVVNDTISNNKVMDANEKEYRNIVHPQNTKALAFTNQIVAPPNSGHQCWFLIEELRISESHIDSKQVLSKYKALNPKHSEYTLHFFGELPFKKIAANGEYNLENWNVSLKDKRVENIYIISILSPGREDADLRCIL